MAMKWYKYLLLEMEDPRNTRKNKQNLKNWGNELEMHEVTQRQNDYDIDELNISQIDEDELERKSQLLDQRLKILEKTRVETWNQIFPIFNIIAILSISGMQFGFGTIQITTVYDQTQLLQIYHLRGMPIGLGIGLLVGLMPIGAIFGTCFGKYLIKKLRLKNAHHAINILCMISSFALMQILNPGTILAGRFLYGVCVAFYCAWSPKYIQDLAPVNLKLFAKSIYSIWVIGSIMLGYFLGTIFFESGVSNYFRIMFCLPGILAFIQMTLMHIFVPHSPAELFQKQQYEQGRQVLQQIYKEEFIDMMMDKFKLEAEVKALRINTHRDQHPYKEGRIKARFMGIYLNIFREFVGVTTILIYSGYFIGQGNFKLGQYTNIILSLVAFLATVLSHVFLAERCGRKALMFLSTVIFAICNFVIMAGMLTRKPTLMFVFIILFVLVFGITYSIVSSIYPAEILKNERVSYTSFTSWPAMVFATLIPPIMGDVIEPSHMPWPVFLFYGVYALLSAIYLWCCAVESNNRQYNDILKQF